MRPADLLRQARAQAGITQSEVARRAGTSQPNVNRTERGVSEPELATLRRMLGACGFDLVLQLKPHTESPLAHLLDERRREIIGAAARHGATDVRVFGSIARGEPEPADVDLLVSLEPGRDLVDLAALRNELNRLLGVNVDVTTLELLRPDVRKSASSEAIPL